MIDGSERSGRQKILMALADRIDHEELWRRPAMDHHELSAEQRDRLEAGVMLRRYAALWKKDHWTLFPPKGPVHYSAKELEKVVEMATKYDRARPATAKDNAIYQSIAAKYFKGVASQPAEAVSEAATMKLVDEAIHAYAAWFAEFTYGPSEDPPHPTQIVDGLFEKKEITRERVRAAILALAATSVAAQPAKGPLTVEQIKACEAEATKPLRTGDVWTPHQVRFVRAIEATHVELSEAAAVEPVKVDVNAALHPATAALVANFSRALAEKLAAAEVKYGYEDGWMSGDWMDECREKLLEHVAKGDPRDVAAYCAFLWHHGESTAPASAQAGAVPATLPESMSRDEMLKYYSEYANLQSNEALRYQKRIRDLERALHYTAFALHDTPQHILAKGITLLDNDRVQVKVGNLTVDTGRIPDPFTLFDAVKEGDN